MLLNKKLKLSILLLLTILLIAFIFYSPVVSNPQQSNKIELNHNSTNTEFEFAKVIKVIDGDTFITQGGNKVRLIGIDAPEMNYNKNKEAECKAKEATLALENMILNKTVRLEKDKQDIDKYGRLLRYVYIDNLFVNGELVKLGLAKVKRYYPNIKHHKYLKNIEKQAKQMRLGIFSCSY